jgi:hypothetical protein
VDVGFVVKPTSALWQTSVLGFSGVLQVVDLQGFALNQTPGTALAMQGFIYPT